MSLGWRIAAVFGIQALALICMVADRQWTLMTGTQIVLETAPVDPRSLFSGDYVALSYKVSRLRPAELGGDRDFRRHDGVYVLLRRGEPYWEPVSVHKAAPTPPPGHVVLRGEVTDTGTRSWDPEQRRTVEGATLFVRYGIESYFVPEGEGRAIERPTADEKISIRVAVDARARAAIQALLVNGKERYVEQLL